GVLEARAVLALPDLLARLHVEAEDELGLLVGAHRKEAVADDGGARVAATALGVGPEQLRSVRRPLLEQSRLLRDVGAVGAAPLWPVEPGGIGGRRRGGDDRQRQRGQTDEEEQESRFHPEPQEQTENRVR